MRFGGGFGGVLVDVVNTLVLQNVMSMSMRIHLRLLCMLVFLGFAFALFRVSDLA